MQDDSPRDVTVFADAITLNYLRIAISRIAVVKPIFPLRDNDIMNFVPYVDNQYVIIALRVHPRACHVMASVVEIVSIIDSFRKQDNKVLFLLPVHGGMTRLSRSTDAYYRNMKSIFKELRKNYPLGEDDMVQVYTSGNQLSMSQVGNGFCTWGIETQLAIVKFLQEAGPTPLISSKRLRGPTFFEDPTEMILGHTEDDEEIIWPCDPGYDDLERLLEDDDRPGEVDGAKALQSVEASGPRSTAETGKELEIYKPDVDVGIRAL